MEEFTKEQERINANTHFIGTAIGLVAIPVLLVVVAVSPESLDIDLVGALVYGLGFIMVFTFSALYHYHSRPAAKDRFEIWDHIGIYFMIAGTYTPFIIAYADKDDRYWLLAGVWALALIGSVFKFFFPSRFRILSMLLYVILGLLWFLAPASFKENVPSVQFYWILAGAIVYCLGLIFYVKAFFKHHHAVWHLFVLGGACCHYVGVLTMFI